jgi:NAD(P)H-flavin reductase
MASLPRAEPPAAALLPRSSEVLAISRETADTWTLTLPAEGPHTFAPGQFNMLYAFGVGEVPISFSGDPADPARLVHTIRAVGPVTRALCALEVGDSLGVRGPFGTSWPVEQAQGRDALFVGGGIGIAPLRPAIYRVLAERGAYGRVVVLVGTRRPEDRLFSAELAEWKQDGAIEVHQTVDAAGVDWTDNVGVVTTLLPRLGLDGPETVAFLCGPEVMMRFTAYDLIGVGVDPAEVYVSLERNMKCAVATCGHCQLGGSFVCKDGPVYAYPRVSAEILVREL